MVRIVVVEDEGVVALDIKRHLENFGYQVMGIHSSGEEALERLPEEEPTLILMDIRLQGEMDGLETAELIKQRYGIPVILLTAYADERTLERAKGIEPFGYIIKPFKERELRTAIEMALYRYRLEQQLQESEERYRRFFLEDLSADFVADNEGTILACNHSFVNTFGFDSIQDAAESSLGDLFPDSRRWEEFWRALREKKKLVLHEMDLKRKDGKNINLLANVVADEDGDGEIGEIKGYLIDISKRKELEQQLRQSQKMEAIGRLAGGVAHDFNNILTVIMGYSSMLREKSKNTGSDLQQEVHGIEDAAKRASSLTRQLLAFSRRQVLRPETVNLNELVRNIKKMIRRLISEEIDMRLTLQAEEDAVYIDPGQIEQVLMNLAVNARDAMQGSGTLTIETFDTRVNSPVYSRMGEVPHGDYVCLRVKDTGAGIDKSTQGMMFEPFFTTKSEEKGTGLGLSTVYGIVKQSNGYVSVSSEIGKGTCFTIYLPQSTVEEEVSQEKKVETSSLHGDERILVVEDEDSVRQLMEKLLYQYGYSVMSVDGPEEAMKICSNRKRGIDLLITDIVMPGMRGGQLAEKVRELIPEIKVVFVSGYPQKKLENEKYIQSGDRFISKPFEPRGFMETIREVLDGELMS
jgi:PAS domain S-box-containing protein